MEDKKASGPFPGPPGPSFYSAASSPLLALSGVKHCLRVLLRIPPALTHNVTRVAGNHHHESFDTT